MGLSLRHPPFDADVPVLPLPLRQLGRLVALFQRPLDYLLPGLCIGLRHLQGLLEHQLSLLETLFLALLLSLFRLPLLLSCFPLHSRRLLRALEQRLRGRPVLETLGLPSLRTHRPLLQERPRLLWFT